MTLGHFVQKASNTDEQLDGIHRMAFGCTYREKYENDHNLPTNSKIITSYDYLLTQV